MNKFALVALAAIGLALGAVQAEAKSPSGNASAKETMPTAGSGGDQSTGFYPYGPVYSPYKPSMAHCQAVMKAPSHYTASTVSACHAEVAG